MPSALTNNQYHGHEAYTLQPFVLLLVFLNVLASLLSCWSLFASQPTFVLQIAWRHLIQLALVDTLRSSCMFLVAETFATKVSLSVPFIKRVSHVWTLRRFVNDICMAVEVFVDFVMNLCFKKKKKMSLHCDRVYFVLIISLLFSNFSVLINVGTRLKGWCAPESKWGWNRLGIDNIFAGSNIWGVRLKFQVVFHILYID